MYVIFLLQGKGDGERVSQAGEAGHMLDILSGGRSEHFACALALQLGLSFLQANTRLDASCSP